jgi:hypothetical protein
MLAQGHGAHKASCQHQQIAVVPALEECNSNVRDIINEEKKFIDRSYCK